MATLYVSQAGSSTVTRNQATNRMTPASLAQALAVHAVGDRIECELGTYGAIGNLLKAGLSSSQKTTLATVVDAPDGFRATFKVADGSTPVVRVAANNIAFERVELTHGDNATKSTHGSSIIETDSSVQAKTIDFLGCKLGNTRQHVVFSRYGPTPTPGEGSATLNDSGWRFLGCEIYGANQNLMVAHGTAWEINSWVNPYTGLTIRSSMHDWGSTTETGQGPRFNAVSGHSRGMKIWNTDIDNLGVSGPFLGSAISQRASGLDVNGITIHDCIPFDRFWYDNQRGKTRIYNCKGWNLKGYLFRVDAASDTAPLYTFTTGSTPMDDLLISKSTWHFSDATIAGSGNLIDMTAANAAYMGDIEIVDNVFTGDYFNGWSFGSRASAFLTNSGHVGTFHEHNNYWFRSNKPFGSGGPLAVNPTTLAGLTAQQQIDMARELKRDASGTLRNSDWRYWMPGALELFLSTTATKWTPTAANGWGAELGGVNAVFLRTKYVAPIAADGGTLPAGWSNATGTGTGNSKSDPWTMLQAQRNYIAGDDIIFCAGNYHAYRATDGTAYGTPAVGSDVPVTLSRGNNVATAATFGTVQNPVRWRSEDPNNKAKIKWLSTVRSDEIVHIQQSCIIFDGLEFDGNLAASPAFAGSQVRLYQTLSDGSPLKHIAIVNCHIHDTIGGGIATNQCDYVRFDSNVIWNCRGVTQNSGISYNVLGTTIANDGYTGFHNYIVNNIITGCEGPTSDGNGIILDNGDVASNITLPPMLVANNLCYWNGNRGIHSFKCAGQIYIVHNTCSTNGLDTTQSTGPAAGSTGEFNQGQGTATWANNFAIPWAGSGATGTWGFFDANIGTSVVTSVGNWFGDGGRKGNSSSFATVTFASLAQANVPMPTNTGTLQQRSAPDPRTSVELFRPTISHPNSTFTHQNTTRSLTGVQGAGSLSGFTQGTGSHEGDPQLSAAPNFQSSSGGPTIDAGVQPDDTGLTLAYAGANPDIGFYDFSPPPQVVQIMGIDEGSSVGSPDVATDALSFSVVLEPDVIARDVDSLPAGVLTVTPQVGDYVYQVLAYNQSGLTLTADLPEGYTLITSKLVSNRVALYAVRKVWQPGDTVNLPNWRIHDATDLESQRNFVLFAFVLRGVDAARAEVGFVSSSNATGSTRASSGLTTIATPPLGGYMAGFVVGRPGGAVPQHVLNQSLSTPSVASGWFKKDEWLSGTAGNNSSITASCYSCKLASNQTSQSQLVVDIADSGGEAWGALVIQIAPRTPANQSFQISGIASTEQVGAPSFTQSSNFQVIQNPTLMTKGSSATPGGTLGVTPQVDDYVYYAVQFNQNNLGDLSANAPTGWTVIAQRSTTDRVAVYVARKKWTAADTTTLPTWLLQDSTPANQVRGYTTWSAVLRGVDPSLQEVGFSGFGNSIAVPTGNTGLTTIGTLPANGYIMAFVAGKPGNADGSHTVRTDSVPTSGWTKGGDVLQGTAGGNASLQSSAWYQALSGGAKSQAKLSVDFANGEQYAAVVLEVAPAGASVLPGTPQTVSILGVAAPTNAVAIGKPGVSQTTPGGGGDFIPGRPDTWNKDSTAGGHLPSLTVFDADCKFGPQTSDYYDNAAVRAQPRGTLRTHANTADNAYYYYPRQLGYTAISITPGTFLQIELSKAPPITGPNAWTVGAQVYLNDFIGTSAGNLSPKPDGMKTIKSISGTTITFNESYTLNSGIYNTNSPGYALLASQRGADDYYEVSLTKAQIEAHTVCPQTGTPFFTQDPDGYWRWTGGYCHRFILEGADDPVDLFNLKIRIHGNLDVVNAAPGFRSNVDQYLPGLLNPYSSTQFFNCLVDINGMGVLGSCGGTMAYSQNLGGYYLPQGESISYNSVSGVFEGVINRGGVYDLNKMGGLNKNLIWRHVCNYRNELAAGVVPGPDPGMVGNGGHTDCYQFWYLDNSELPFGTPTWEWVFMQCGGNAMIFANEAAGGSGTKLIANAWAQSCMAWNGNKFLSLSASQDMGARRCWVNAASYALKAPTALEVKSEDIESHPFTRGKLLFPETTHEDTNWNVGDTGALTPIDRPQIPTGWGKPKALQPPGADFVYVNQPGGVDSPTPQAASINGIATGEKLGTPTIHANITTNILGIASTDKVGTSSVTVGGARVNILGIASVEKVGTPSTGLLRFVQILGIASNEKIGKPSIGVSGRFIPILGVASEEKVGLADQKQPHNKRTGTFQPTRGIETVIQFGDLMLNNLMISSLPAWANDGILTKITSVAGMADSPDVRDARDPNPEIDGETIYKSLYGGRTVTIEGWVYGQNIDDLQRTVAKMRSSFSVRSEQLLTFTPVHNDGVAATEAQVTLMARPTAFSIKETQTDTQIRRSFQVTFRAADPLIRTATVTSPFHKDLTTSTNGTITVVNNGNTDDFPIVTIASTDSSNFKGDIENLTSGERMSLNLTNDAKVNCRTRSITTTAGTIVWGLHRMKSVSGDTSLKQVDWLRLVPGPNSLQIVNRRTGTSPLPNSCTIEMSQGAWV